MKNDLSNCLKKVKVIVIIKSFFFMESSLTFSTFFKR